MVCVCTGYHASGSGVYAGVHVCVYVHSCVYVYHIIMGCVGSCLCMTLCACYAELRDEEQYIPKIH